MGVDHAVPAELAAVADDDARMEGGAVADLDLIADRDEGMDGDVPAQGRRLGDGRHLVDADPSGLARADQVGPDREERGDRVVDLDDRHLGLAGSTGNAGPTIAAEAGDAFRSRAYRSLSMNVMSPGPASSTGRAELIGTLPSPSKPAPDQGCELFHRGGHERLPFFPERS